MLKPRLTAPEMQSNETADDFLARHLLTKVAPSGIFETDYASDFINLINKEYNGTSKDFTHETIQHFSPQINHIYQALKSYDQHSVSTESIPESVTEAVYTAFEMILTE